ncbi:MAG: hypothetical protein O2894_09510 [Planctomycetota bacterium]|nr:hypothetical protein [Planctomycetota bacterium]
MARTQPRLLAALLLVALAGLVVHRVAAAVRARPWTGALPRAFAEDGNADDMPTWQRQLLPQRRP